MALRSLSVENYKSIRSLTLAPRSLSVLLGANATGKSNVFDAFRFIHDRVVKGIARAVSERGDESAIPWRGRSLSDAATAFGFKGEFDPVPPSKAPMVYQFSYGSTDLRNWSVVLEDLRSTGRDWLRNKNGTTIALDFFGSERYSITAGQPLTANLAAHESVEPLPAFVREVRGWQFYNFMPALMREPGQAARQENLDEHGRNFSAWLVGIQMRRRDVFEKIVSLLRGAVRTVRDVGSDLSPSGQTTVFVEEDAIVGPLSLKVLSDGTLRLLAQLAVLHQPDPPNLLCLEEPESFVHPRLLRLLADEIKSASKRFPIMVSTHSPLLVDHFDAENIIIVEKRDGGTTVTPIGTRDDLKQMIHAMEAELGEIWYSGALGGVASKLD